VNRAKLSAFYEHADETNDIFRVAAQVIASTIVTADNLLQQAAADAAEGPEAGAAYARAISAAAAGERIAARVVTPADAAAQGAGSTAAAGKDEQQEAAAAFARATGAAQPGSTSQQLLVAAAADSQQQYLQALQAAFLPFAVGHKAAWWDVVAEQQEDTEQSDSDSEEVDAAELRAQLQELAADSLALLRAGLQDSRFPQLFDLQVSSTTPEASLCLLLSLLLFCYSRVSASSACQLLHCPCSDRTLLPLLLPPLWLHSCTAIWWACLS
jgi:hypothetical protein